MIFDIGRICVKLAGRDAGRLCVVLSHNDDGTVVIDGFTRRRKCNTVHLEPTANTLDISEGASHGDVVKAFKDQQDVEIPVSTTSKEKTKSSKPKKQKVVKSSSKDVAKK